MGNRVQPYLPPLIGLAALAVGWVLFLGVDVMNVGGLQDALKGTSVQYPATWFYIFAEGGPIEIMQWLSLGCACTVAALSAGQWWSRGGIDQPVGWFWLMMSFGLMLLLIEDAGNPRHTARQWAEVVVAEPAGGLAAGAVLVIVAGLPLLAVACYGRSMWRFSRTRSYLFLAFAAYGVVAILAATGDGWYVSAGAAINDAAGGDLVRVDEYYHSTEFWLMDYMVEESVELIAATLMLAAAIAFTHEPSEHQ